MKRGLLLAGLIVLSLAGCGGGGDDPSGSGSVGDAPTASDTSAAAVTTPAPAPAASPVAAAAPLNCAQLATAPVASAAVHLADYDASPVVLAAGRYTGSDGSLVALQPACGIGDLNGDGAADALSVVKISFGGTGQFWTLVAWTSNAGAPQLAASKALGDRNPVTDITVAGQRATVVYLTRTADVPLAGVNVKRTAIYQLTGGSLTEVSYTDAPYTP